MLKLVNHDLHPLYSFYPTLASTSAVRRTLVHLKQELRKTEEIAPQAADFAGELAKGSPSCCCVPCVNFRECFCSDRTG